MTVIELLVADVMSVWVTAAWIIFHLRRWGREPGQLLRHLFHELRPFYWPALVAKVLTHSWLGGWSTWHLIILGCTVANWWIFKDVDTDDRWKRRREKLAAKVSRVGARLTVEPAGTP